jgi:organic radical activating enzyme
MGVPVVFVRLAGCNLLCIDCDTQYSWDEGKEMSVVEVKKEIIKVAKEINNKTNLVILTGGEPLLQAKELNKLIASFSSTIYWGVETNGTIFAYLGSINDNNVTFVISPKLSSFSPRGLKEYNQHWSEAAQNTNFVNYKFVVDSEDDIEELQAFIKEENIPNSAVWIMPKGKTKEEQLKRFPMIWNFCVEQGYNFSPRLHILTFGAKRGV